MRRGRSRLRAAGKTFLDRGEARRHRRRWETEKTVFGGGRRNGVDVAFERARVNSILVPERAERKLHSNGHSFSRRNANYRSGMRYDCFCNTVPVTQVQATDSSLGFLFRQLNRNSCSHFRPPFRPSIHPSIHSHPLNFVNFLFFIFLHSFDRLKSSPLANFFTFLPSYSHPSNFNRELMTLA